MANQTVIEELALTLSLDLTQFEKDYAGASKQVTAATQKLNRDMRLEKLRMDIDSSKFAGAENSTAALSSKLGHLNTMLAQQKNVVALTAKAHDEAVKKYDANSAAAKKLEERLLREQSAQAKLEMQIRQVNKVRGENSKLSKISAAGGQAYDAAGAAMAAVAVISVKAATDAVESESLFETSFGSMADKAREWSVGLRKELGLNDYEMRKQAGTLYVMTQSMGLSNDQAYQLATGMTMLAQDMASFYNLSTEEAFTKIKSGITGEMEPLKALGILVDESTVKQEAYNEGIAKVGDELTQQQKVLARYSTIMRQTSTAQGDLARTADSPANQMRRLRAEVQLLEIELGQKLLPAFKGLMEDAQGAMNAFNRLSDAQKNVVMEMVKVGAEIAIVNTGLKGMTWMLGAPLPWWAKLAAAIAIATKGLTDYAEKQEEIASKDITGRNVDSLNAKVRKTADGTYVKETEEIDVPMAILQSFAMVKPSSLPKKEKPLSEEELAQLEKQQNEPDEETKKRKLLEQEEAKEKERIEKQKQAQIAATAKETKALADETYKVTHNALQAELYDIDQKAKEYRDKQLDEVTVTKWAESQKAKIMQDFADNTLSQIDAAFQSSLEARLAGIEKEKKAYQQKGADEVTATKWAEEEKRKAIQEVALDAIKNNRKRLEAIREAMDTRPGSIDIQYEKDGITKSFSQQTSGAENVQKNLQYLMQTWREEDRKKLGITSNDTFSPALIQQYEKMQNDIQNNLIPGLEQAAIGNMSGITGAKNIQAPVTINIQNPVVMDTATLNQMADQVAGVIEPTIDRAIKNAENGY